MPSPSHTDRSAVLPPDPGAVDDLITRARLLRGEVDAVRRDAEPDEEDPRSRWRRALCDLAVHQLEDLGEHLGQLREGLAGDAPPQDTGCGAYASVPRPDPSPRAGASPRAGNAQWDLLTDTAVWSPDLYLVFGRDPEEGPLTLDELPSWLLAEDQRTLTSMVTGCLVDGSPIDGEFRIVRADGRVRTVHMTGEPVLDSQGATSAMWAVIRDVSELRLGRWTLRETRETLERERQIARTEHRMAVELRETVLSPWRGPLSFPQDGGPAVLDLAARYLPAGTSTPTGGDWYDALQLPGEAVLLAVGDLTGHGVAAISGVAMLLGALRGMAVAGLEPAPLMGRLNQFLDSSAQPLLSSALCCRYEPSERTLVWSQAGHPAPLLFRNGAGRVLEPPDGVLLGATSDARYTQVTESVLPGDLLVLHTDGLVPRRAAHTRPDTASATSRLLGMAPRFAEARTAQDCLRTAVEEFGAPDREDESCLLVARFL